PLDEVARFLGGVSRHPSATQSPAGVRESATTKRGDRIEIAIGLDAEFSAPRRAIKYRPVTIVDAGHKKALKLHIEVPVEDMGRPAPASSSSHPPSPDANPGGSSHSEPTSIWSAIHPRLLELIRAHRSTLVFVNSRRLSERLAGALNELAGETLVRSHHGSIARAQRVEVEDLLKAGALRALVATS